MKPKAEGGLSSVHGEGGILGSTPRATASTPATHESLNQPILGVNIVHKDFDIPVVYNKEVENWVEYFTGRGRKYFGIYLERMGEYQGIIQPKLKAAGLPQDLIFLAMIESGFSTQAKSRVGAGGQWQFMRSTGRLFGLRSDWWVDERRDPSKSTDAAIQYLGRLYGEFGDWNLSAAAYNSGEVKIRRAIARLKTRDFWEIAQNRRALRKETKDYVPKMLAAAIIAKNADQFGFKPVQPDLHWLNTVNVEIPKPENLRTIAKVANIDREELLALNPELLHACTPPKVGAYSIRVPKGDASTRLLAGIQSGEIGQYKDFDRHVIHRGDSLSRIASSHHVPVEAVLAMNDIRSVRSLRPGTEIIIPEGGVVSRRSSTPGRRIASQDKKAPPGRKHVLYVVRKGDTLGAISRRYAVRIQQIRAWNSLRQLKILRPGSRIKLYVKNDYENI